MRKKINFNAISLIISILVICFTVSSYLFAVWQEPTAGPPGNNILPPINVSSTGQNKLGDFGIGGGSGQPVYWLSNYYGTLRFNSASPAGTRLVIGQDGNVGIGTTGPTMALTVAGQQLITSTAPELDWNKSNASANEGRWRIEGDTAKIMSFRAVNDAINDSTEWMRATRSSGITMSSVTFPNGNVGIGTTGPSHKLQLVGANNATELEVSSADQGSGAILLGDGSTALKNVGIWRGNANSYAVNGNFLNFGTYGDGGFTFAAGNAELGSQSERVRIEAGGNVGIGTTSPGVKLDIVGGDVQGDGFGRFKGWSTGGATGLAAELGISGGVGYFDAYNRTTSAHASVHLGNTLGGVFVKGSDGNVGIGTTGPTFGYSGSVKGLVIAAGTNEWVTVLMNNGNVGIGTTGPGVALHVDAPSSITSTQYGIERLVARSTGVMANGFEIG